MKLSLRLTLLFLSALVLGGCTGSTPGGKSAPPSPAALLPPASIVPGWTVAQPAQTFSHDTLYSLVDGQADSFFAYDFESAATERYQNASGVMLTVQIWQVATPADAFGLFTFNRAGAPATIGKEGDTDPGRRLAFWQNQYYVYLNASQSVPDDQLLSFAQNVVSKLPASGEPPALVNGLPASGLEPRSAIFFHAALSLQNELWLSDDNILGLGPTTNGVVARYTLQGAPVHLLIVQYAAAAPAATALSALQQLQGIDLAAAAVQQSVLGAVVGQTDPGAAKALVDQAIGGAQP